MSDCRNDCTRLTAIYHADCNDCKARAIASSPAAWKAANGQTNTELREAIARIYPADIAGGRAKVWEWMQRLGVAK
jgi:hypothetical protein